MTYDWIPLYEDELVVWLPPDHPWTEEESITLAHLDDAPFYGSSPFRTAIPTSIASWRLTSSSRISASRRATPIRRIAWLKKPGHQPEQPLDDQTLEWAASSFGLSNRHSTSLWALPSPIFKNCRRREQIHRSSLADCAGRKRQKIPGKGSIRRRKTKNKPFKALGNECYFREARGDANVISSRICSKYHREKSHAPALWRIVSYQVSPCH